MSVSRKLLVDPMSLAVKINYVQLPQSVEVKYLGLHLDRLTWHKHIFTKRKQLGLTLTKKIDTTDVNAITFLVLLVLVQSNCSNPTLLPCVSKSKSHYNRQLVGQSVLVPGAHLGPATNFNFSISLRFSFRQLRFVML
jgi:hypothetical protein